VRLAAYARRDEIEIMQLVGAPIAYVADRSSLEGILQGGGWSARGARAALGWIRASQCPLRAARLGALAWMG